MTKQCYLEYLIPKMHSLRLAWAQTGDSTHYTGWTWFSSSGTASTLNDFCEGRGFIFSKPVSKINISGLTGPTEAPPGGWRTKSWVILAFVSACRFQHGGWVTNFLLLQLSRTLRYDVPWPWLIVSPLWYSNKYHLFLEEKIHSRHNSRFWEVSQLTLVE